MRLGISSASPSVRVRSLSSGFTIVELLIVVVVIAILATITIVAFNGVQNRARDSAAQTTAAQAFKKLATSAAVNSDAFPADKAAFLTATGITEGDGVSYQYTSSNNNMSYCLTTVSRGIAYFTTNTSTSPALGACPGHTSDGSAPIVNLVRNPSLETDGNGWNSTSASLNPTRIQISGKWVQRGVRSDTAAAAFRASYTLPSTVTVGNTYTASTSAYSSAAGTLTVMVRQAGTTNTIYSTDYTFAAGETKRISTTGTATTGSVYVSLYSLTGAVGTTYTMDEVMLTEGSTVYNYADGDSAGWIWDGTVGNSTSRGPAL